MLGAICNLSKACKQVQQLLDFVTFNMNGGHYLRMIKSYFHSLFGLCLKNSSESIRISMITLI